MIIDVEITDPDTYAEYVERVPAVVETFGGHYLARGSHIRVISGDWRRDRIIILEFPSISHIRQWLASPEYAPPAALREKSTRTRAIVVEGL